MFCSYANVDAKVLDEIKGLEKKLGKVLLAYACTDSGKPSALSADELALITSLEGKLGLSLVAVDA